LKLFRFVCVATTALFLLACSSKSLGDPCSVGGDCPKGLFCCSSVCVDPKADEANCGSCGNVCGTAHAGPHCDMGVCKLTCASGYGDCDGVATNGCEVELDSNAAHCGECGTTCAAANTMGACIHGGCASGVCGTGFGDCDHTPVNGCETDLRSSVDHCGKCSTPCNFANGAGVCVASKCQVTGCDAGFANCDSVAANGCEVDTIHDDLNCGGCGQACPTGHCVRGGCRSPDLILFGGQQQLYTQTATNLVTRYTLDSHQYYAMPTLGTSPPARYGHAAAYDSAADRMIIWGGVEADSTGVQDAPPDLYALDFSTETPTWRKLATNLDGGESDGGVDGGPVIGVPVARDSMAYAWDDANRTLWIFGGMDQYSYNTYADLWSLDVSTMTWTQQWAGDAGGGPLSRTDAVMFLAPELGGIVIGRGESNFGQAYSDYHLWSDGGWTTLSASGTIPSQRTFPAVLGTQKPALFYGGVSYSTGVPLSDLYQVDFDDAGFEFTPLTSTGALPRARYYPAGCSSLGLRYMLLGSVESSFNYYNVSDVWSYDADAGWFMQNDGDGGSYFADDAGIDDDAGTVLQGPPGVLRVTCVARQ